MEDYSKTPLRSSSYAPGPSTSSSPRSIAAKTVFWCGQQIPGSLSGINYESRNESNGFYHLDRSPKYQAIIKGINAVRNFEYAIHGLHIHMIEGNVVVTVTFRKEGDTGEKTAHFKFDYGKGELSMHKPTEGVYNKIESVKELAGIAIQDFADKVKANLTAALPKFTKDQMGEKYGGEEYKGIIESQQKAIADRNKQLAEQEANENLVAEHESLIRLASGNPFLTMFQSTAAKRNETDFKGWFLKEFEKNGAQILSDYDKKEETPLASKRKEVSQEEERSEKRQRQVTDLSIDKTKANKIVSNVKNDSNLLRKVSILLTKKSSNKEVINAFKGNSLTSEDWAKVIPKDANVGAEREPWEIVQALEKALKS